MLRLQTRLPDAYASATPAELGHRIRAAKSALGDRLLILGHHYQRDEIMQWADLRGDSFGLSRMAADAKGVEYVVFCGVHFMAESADILTDPHVRVVLPDLNAGCSMADMADIESVEEAWAYLQANVDINTVVPITYMNSSAALKAFVGDHGGAVCTSSNARAVLTWALEVRGAKQVLFFPDQHLGRNTALAMGFSHDDMRVWNPRATGGGLTKAELTSSTFLLWKGHCTIHQRFTPEQVHAARAEHPGVQVVAHPEAPYEVCDLADAVGSTDFILRYIEAAPAGSTIAVATEVHLVNRLANEAKANGTTVFSLDPLICPCATMNRIDEPHLAWVLDHLVEGNVVNEISVDSATAESARVALQRMLDIV